MIPADYDELLTHGRIVRRIEALDSDSLRAIREAEVPAEYAHLDAQVGRRTRPLRTARTE